jgi:hypothetical protein
MHLKLLAGFIVAELLWWVEAQSTCEVAVPGLATALSQEISLREQVRYHQPLTLSFHPANSLT